MSTTSTKLARKLQARRHDRDFARALRAASPSMRQELIVAATRDFSR